MPNRRVPGLPSWAQPRGVQHQEVDYTLEPEEETQQVDDDADTDETLGPDDPDV